MAMNKIQLSPMGIPVKTKNDFVEHVSKEELKFHPVVELISEGVKVRDACARCGVTASAYNVARFRHKRLQELHDKAISMRADDVVDSLLSLATGEATEEKQVLDSEGNVVTLKSKVPPNVAAIKYALNNIAKEKWAEKVESVAPVTNNNTIIMVERSLSDRMDMLTKAIDAEKGGR